MRICFLARPNYDRLSAALFNKLKPMLGDDFSAGFITCNDDETAFIKNKTGSDTVSQSDVFLKEHWTEFCMEKLCEYEKKYDCAPMWKYIYTDRFLIFHDYDYAVRIACGMFMFCESIFSGGEYDYYYDEPLATLMSYVAYIVGKYYGVKYVCQMAGRTHGMTHHYLVTDPFQHNHFLYNGADVEYGEEELSKAEEFLKDFESKSIVKENAVFKTRKPRFEPVYVKLALLYHFNKKYKNKYDYINYRLDKQMWDRAKFYFRYRKMIRLCENTDYSEKFVYFPLHYQPEASTIVCAQMYEKQLFYIDSLAKSLPADTVLYVKEHYVLLGHKKLDFYRALSAYPNVRLISPWEDGKKLIQKAEAVVSLAGTPAWEAMLLGKPAFLSGKMYFDSAPGIINADVIYQNYLPLLKQWRKPERTDIIRYLCAYFRTLEKGHIYAAISSCYTDENITNLANSLLSEISRLEKEEKTI